MLVLWQSPDGIGAKTKSYLISVSKMLHREGNSIWVFHDVSHLIGNSILVVHSMSHGEDSPKWVLTGVSYGEDNSE